MRWPIRNQILFPILLIQAITLAAVAAASAWHAVQQAERELHQQLANVMRTLEDSTYPLTPSVLHQLRNLSGAEYAVFRSDGAVSTDDVPAGRIGELRQLIDQLPKSAQFFDSRSAISIGGRSWFAGVVSRHVRADAETVVVLFPEERRRSARVEAVKSPLVIGGVGLLLMSGASVWIARRTAGRIQSLQQHVAGIARGGFSAVPVSRTNDELRDLSADINHMAATLHSLMNNIRETERSTVLSQIVGSLAHQLRNSLTGARISVQLHQRHCATADDPPLNVALRQLQLTEEQIKSLLRLTVGGTQPPVPAEVQSILDETASLVRPICDHRRIDFSYRRDDVDAAVADADAIRASLLSIVMNAIEAAGPGGHLEIEARVGGGWVIIEVSDDGAGVLSEHTEAIFQMFFTTKPEGAGLGLAMARKAVEDCGGSLFFERRDDRTVFTMRLPECRRKKSDESLMS